MTPAWSFSNGLSRRIEVDHAIGADIAARTVADLVAAAHLCVLGQFPAVDAVAEADGAETLFVGLDDEVVSVLVAVVAVNQAGHFVPGILAAARHLHRYRERRLRRHVAARRRIAVGERVVGQHAERAPLAGRVVTQVPAPDAAVVRLLDVVQQRCQAP